MTGRRRHLLPAILTAAVLLGCGAGLAKSDPFDDGDANHRLALRTSLTVGVGTYDHLPDLGQNPGHDAERIHQALQSLRFDDRLLANPTRTDLLTALDELKGRVERRPGALLVYFAGHGVTIGDSGYVAPRDAPDVDRLRASGHAADYLISFDQIYSAIRRANPRAAIVIIDACRDALAGTAAALQASPPQPGFRAFVAWSALPGGVAPNGVAEDSPFTQTLLNWVPRSEFDIATLFRKIRTILAQPPVRQEAPVYDDLLGDFHFMMTKKEFMQEQEDYSNVEHNGASSDYFNFMSSYPVGYYYDNARDGYKQAQQREWEEKQKPKDAGSGHRSPGDTGRTGGSDGNTRQGSAGSAAAPGSTSYFATADLPKMFNMILRPNPILGNSMMLAWNGSGTGQGPTQAPARSGDDTWSYSLAPTQHWAWMSGDLDPSAQGSYRSKAITGTWWDSQPPPNGQPTPHAQLATTIPLDLEKRQLDQALLSVFLKKFARSPPDQVEIQSKLPSSLASSDRVSSFSITQKIIRILVDRGMPRAHIVVFPSILTGAPAVTLTMMNQQK